MRSLICTVVLSAICVCPLVGCDGGGDLVGDAPKDATSKNPSAMPGMDVMKEKMDKKKKR